MKISKGIISILLVAIQCVSLFMTPVSAENTENANNGGLIIASDKEQKYSDQTHFAPAENPISLINENATELQNGQTADFTVLIPKDGAYNLVLCFRPLSKEVKSASYEVYIDGVLPFTEAETLRADCIYENDGEITYLSTGDEIAPNVKHIDGVMQAVAYDITGVESMPYEFSLAAGTHKISIVAKDSEFFIYGTTLHLNDNDTFEDQHKIPGMGIIDWDDIFSALDEIGYKGVYNMELNLYHYGKNFVVEVAEFAVKVMHHMLKERYGEQ